MSTATVPSTLPVSFLPEEWSEWTLGDLQAYLDDIPADRIRMWPPPGQATEEDVLRISDETGCLCELIDGILVEKTMGWYESRLASLIGHWIETFLETNDIGMTLTSDGPFRLRKGRMRMPDVSFLRWSRFPNRVMPKVKVLKMAPDLAIEVLSESNTRREMQRKLEEYFAAGTLVVWYIDPKTRTARVFTSVSNVTDVPEDGTLDGGDLLPGFQLPLRDLFARAGSRGDVGSEES